MRATFDNVSIDAKKWVSRGLAKLPLSAGRVLMGLARNPNIVLGRQYRDYRRFVEDSRNGFDPCPGLLTAVNRALSEIPYYKRSYGSEPVKSLTQFEERFAFIDKDIVLAQLDEFERRVRRLQGRSPLIP